MAIKIDSLQGIRGKCLRCGGTYEGPFPYCGNCSPCPDCKGSKEEIKAFGDERRKVACTTCSGKGFVFLRQESQTEFFSRLFTER